MALRAHSIQITPKTLTDHRCIARIPVPLGEVFAHAGLRRLPVDAFSTAAPTGLTFRRSVADFASIQRIKGLLLTPTSKAEPVDAPIQDARRL